MDNKSLADLTAEQVMGWKPHFRNTALYVDADKHTELCEVTHGFVSDWDPARNPVQSGKILDAMIKHKFWPSMTYKTDMYGRDGRLSDKEVPMWHVRFRCVHGGTRGEGSADSTSLDEAICLAALKAREGAGNRWDLEELFRATGIRK